MIIGSSFAAEITLVCKGTTNYYSSSAGSKEYSDSIEVRFDDALKKITYLDPSRVFGCYGQTELDSVHSCDCSLSETNIKCISTTKTKSGSFKSDQTVNVNRFSGILDFTEISTGDLKDGKYLMTKSGKLMCDSFTKKKF